MLTAFANEVPSVPTEHVLDTLVHIWLASIYGGSH
jgi:TetR/AcrR family transcriptional regulator, ethionamide resistance regulator